MNRLDISQFILKYKRHWINYCEVIIDREGKIIIANPSHVEAMLKLTGRTREDVYNEMPVDASPIHWFVDYLGYISVWNSFQLSPKKITFQQYETLEQLEINNFIRTNIQYV